MGKVNIWMGKVNIWMGKLNLRMGKVNIRMGKVNIWMGKVNIWIEITIYLLIASIYKENCELFATLGMKLRGKVNSRKSTVLTKEILAISKYVVLSHFKQHY